MTPVLWLCGPSGVGKSTVAWLLRERLRDGGVAAAYVDIDQLGMCYPETAADPGRYRLKAHNLGAVVANFAADGATCVVVSGVVDPAYRVRLPGVALTLCRLRVERDELVRRFVGRSGEHDLVPGVLRDASALDASTIADLCVDTTGLTVAESVARVAAATDGWHTATGAPPPLPAHRPADGPILWVSGVPGVGTSMVGYALYLRTMRAGHTVGYLDLRQVGFGGRAGTRHGVRAANVAAVWRAYRDRGADGLVITGEIDAEGAVEHYRAALPTASLAVCRLHADRAALAARILPRGRQRSWGQPGDPLFGRSTEELRQVVDRAAADADVLERAGIGVRVDSTGHDVDSTVDAVIATGVWSLLPRDASSTTDPSGFRST